MFIEKNTFIGIDKDISSFNELITLFNNCSCGEKHECKIKDIEIGSGLKNCVGNILKKNNFPKNILLVADKTTLSVSEGIIESLKDFNITYLIYDSIRVATMQDVKKIESYFEKGIEGVVAVGTGSIHDPCRLASSNKNKQLCLFATAPSMDGFASNSAPIVDNNFKTTYPAKCPEIIIADTTILAKSPFYLKSAGFGDMISKYIALIDWKVSHLIINESYCENVARLTRYAVDSVVKMADKVNSNDEDSAKAIFEGLLLTGIAMSFTKTSRPGSGTEHIMAHFIECKELLENKIPNFHGEDVGVSTLIILKLYKSILLLNNIKAKKEVVDWNKVKNVYGMLFSDVEKLNSPSTITEDINPKTIEDNFDKIKEIINSVPSYEYIKNKMEVAGCKITYKDIDKNINLIQDAFYFHPYMRRRLSLRRLLNMTDFVFDLDSYLN